jgi:hypothetical protein
MDEFLFALLQVFFEALLEFAGEIVVDLLSRSAAEVLKAEEPPHPIGSLLACTLYGAIGGAISLVVLPHPLFPPIIHGLSLFVSPVLTGAAMSGIGTLLRKRGKRVVQIESFPYAFAFALGMALVRFLLVS